MADVVFNAQLNLQVSEAVQKMEGSMQKVGLAYEKELEKRNEATGKMAGRSRAAMGTLGGIGMTAMSGAMNPMMTTQEIEAQLVPKISAALTSAIPYVGGAISKVMETASRHTYQRTGFVHTGAKQQVMGMYDQMAIRGFKPSDEQIDASLQIAEKQRTLMYKTRMRIKGRANAPGVMVSQTTEGAKDVIDAVSDTVSTMVVKATDAIEKLIIIMKEAIKGNPTERQIQMLIENLVSSSIKTE